MLRALGVVLLCVGCSASSTPSQEHLGPSRSASDPPTGKLADPTPSPSAPTAATPELKRRRGDMLLVPGGAFMMGTDAGGEPDEHPQHLVTVAAFYLDETETTNESYEKAVAAHVCNAAHPASAVDNGYGTDRRFRGPRQPISSVRWDDAKRFCEWIGKRLPTEAEWELAARGTDGRRYPWGDDAPTAEHARFAKSVTTDVGSYPRGAGPYGHLDLAGNVWEWVDDVYDPFGYIREGASEGRGSTCEQAMAAFEQLHRTHQVGFTGSNPIPTECERVLRGGAFNYHASGLRVTNRVHHPGRYRLVMSGFRCAQDP